MCPQRERSRAPPHGTARLPRPRSPAWRGRSCTRPACSRAAGRCRRPAPPPGLTCRPAQPACACCPRGQSQPCATAPAPPGCAEGRAAPAAAAAHCCWRARRPGRCCKMQVLLPWCARPAARFNCLRALPVTAMGLSGSRERRGRRRGAGAALGERFGSGRDGRRVCELPGREISCGALCVRSRRAARSFAGFSAGAEWVRAGLRLLHSKQATPKHRWSLEELGSTTPPARHARMRACMPRRYWKHSSSSQPMTCQPTSSRICTSRLRCVPRSDIGCCGGGGRRGMGGRDERMLKRAWNHAHACMRAHCGCAHLYRPEVLDAPCTTPHAAAGVLSQPARSFGCAHQAPAPAAPHLPWSGT